MAAAEHCLCLTAAALRWVIHCLPPHCFIHFQQHLLRGQFGEVIDNLFQGNGFDHWCIDACGPLSIIAL